VRKERGALAPDPAGEIQDVDVDLSRTIGKTGSSSDRPLDPLRRPEELFR